MSLDAGDLHYAFYRLRGIHTNSLNSLATFTQLAHRPGDNRHGSVGG